MRQNLCYSVEKIGEKIGHKSVVNGSQNQRDWQEAMGQGVRAQHQSLAARYRRTSRIKISKSSRRFEAI